LDGFQCIGHHATGLFTGCAPHFQRVTNVVGHRHVRKESVVLKHHADIAPVGRDAGDILAVDAHRAAIGLDETGQNHQDGGFARAGWPQQRNKFVFPDFQTDIPDGIQIAVGLGDAIYGNAGFIVWVGCGGGHINRYP
jgi:hypothetical protein